MTGERRLVAADIPSPPDAAEVRTLVDRAKSGDRVAFGALYDLYAERIYRYILVRVRNPEDAEDITGEVFLNVWSALPRFQWQDVPFLAWVFRISSNQIISHQRRAAARPSRTPIDNLDFVDPQHGPAWLVEQKVTLEEVGVAIKKLPEAQRRVIELRFAGGLSVRETAQALNKSENNVKVLQFKAIERLRKLLPPHGDTASGATGDARDKKGKPKR